MSSHAVVRTHQEPALVLWGCPTYEEAGAVDELLEWHPFLWASPSALPWLEARNMQPDRCISAEEEQNTSPIQFVRKGLEGAQVREINLVLGIGFTPETFLDELSVSALALTLWCQGNRIFRASPPILRLWLHPKGSLSVWVESQWQAQPIDSEGFHSLKLGQPILIRYRPFPKINGM